METISVVIVAQNEAQSIAQALKSAAFADELVVVDGGSTDGTQEVARRMGARIIENPWPGFGAQFNFAIKQATCDWILRVDTDEVVTPELASEVRDVLDHPERSEIAYWIARPVIFMEHSFRYGGLYPDGHLRLWRRGTCAFTELEADETLVPHDPQARTGRLRGALEHHPWADLDELARKTVAIGEWQARDIIRQGRRRRWPGLQIVFAFSRKFLEVYLVKQAWREGLPGFVIATCKAFQVFLRETRLWLHQRSAAGLTND